MSQADEYETALADLEEAYDLGAIDFDEYMCLLNKLQLKYEDA